MIIRVLNSRGDEYALSKETKKSFTEIELEAAKPDADWNAISDKILLVLEKDGFNTANLHPLVYFYETKKGKKIHAIDVQEGDGAG
jgi:hypothetical protein